MSIRNLVVKRL